MYVFSCILVIFYMVVIGFSIFYISLLLSNVCMVLYLQAYDWWKGDRVRVKMPITSYTIKTALFFLTVRHTGLLELNEGYAEALRDALDHVEGQVEIRRNKLQFNPHPKWTSDEDLQQHGEEARVWACKIFSLIKHLAGQGWKLNNYWDRRDPVVRIMDKNRRGFGEAEFICDVCDCALDRLKKNTF